jgi:amino acid transporter
VLYVLLQRACVRGVADLAHARAPLVEAARFHAGPGVARVVEIGTSVSALGICIGMMAMTPRYLSSLARATGLGHALADVDARGVPRRALLVTLALVAALIATGSRAELFALSSVAVLSQYAFTSLSMMVLARRGERGLSRGHLALGIPSLLAALAIATGASRREWAVAAGALALGAVVRLVARRRATA